MTGPGDGAADRRRELARKTIHVGASLAAAGVVWRLPSLDAATALAAATFVALTLEVLRRVAPGFGRWFHRRVGGMMRDREAHRLTGATTLAIGYTLAAVAFPGRPALIGILLTGVADAVAAVVGKRFGSVRYPGGKSLEGSLAFFASAVLLVWAVPGIGLGGALAVAGLATLLEAPTLPVDDNLYLPVAVSAAVAVLAAFSGLGRFS